MVADRMHNWKEAEYLQEALRALRVRGLKERIKRIINIPIRARETITKAQSLSVWLRKSLN
jgi:hypothetical protein